MKKKISVLVAALFLSFYSCNHEDAVPQQNDSASTEEATVDSTNLTGRGNCAAVPGWASQNGGTTGGGSAAETVVTTYAQLKAAIENTSVKVIKVSGTITIPAVTGGRLSFKDQTGKTIYGAAGAKLVSTDQTAGNSGIINIARCKNIIIRNLIFEGPGAYDVDGWDNAILDNCQNVWVDHCEFRDGVDGNFDLKNQSDFISVTYCKFNYLKAPRAGGPGGADDHRFSNLIGSSDSATGDRGKLRITFARCWWASGCVNRLPRVRFGKIHIVNCYYNSPNAKSGIQVGFEADIRVEQSDFEIPLEPIKLMNGTNYTGVALIGNETNVPFITVTKTNAFTPPYSILKIATSAVKADVTASATGAGANLGGNVCGSF